MKLLMKAETILFCLKEITISLYKNSKGARHGGSEKIPPCNKAVVTFTIWGAEDKTEITENFFLCNKFEWKLSQLFLSIGLKKRGEPLKMNWNAVTGAKGKCHVYIDSYKKNDGSDGKSNKIKKLYAYDEQINTIKPANPQQTPNAAWKPGEF